MNSWDLKALDLKPRLPEILSTSKVARAIMLDLAAGEILSDHQVHERAWLVVLASEIQVPGRPTVRLPRRSRRSWLPLVFADTPRVESQTTVPANPASAITGAQRGR